MTFRFYRSSTVFLPAIFSGLPAWRKWGRCFHRSPRCHGRLSVVTCTVFVLLALMLPLHGQEVSGAAEASRVVVLANADDEGSLRIARHYMERRGIPAHRLVALPLSGKETISIDEYIKTLHNPLLDRLLAEGWIRGDLAPEVPDERRQYLTRVASGISYLVVCRGVPLRTDNDPSLFTADEITGMPDNFRFNRAAIDSELAMLLWPAPFSLTAFVRNPLFVDSGVPPAARTAVLRVSRLTGPTVEDVLALIDRTLEAESKGLKGRAYFDLGGPHAEGDEWFEEAVDVAEDLHFDVDVDRQKQVMGWDQRLDAPALYMGWYRNKAYGPWAAMRRSAPPGAIALHLHSFSALTVRSDNLNWVGPLIDAGFCATVGNVYEPYLPMTHRPQVLLKELAAGKTWGEASMAAMPVLSWTPFIAPLRGHWRISCRVRPRRPDKLTCC